MHTDASPHRVLPPLRPVRMLAENNAILRGVTPSFALRPPRGQRISAERIIVELELARARGNWRGRG